MRASVIVFSKAPIAGRVKTRLGAEIGMGRAAALYRNMTHRAVREASKGPWRGMVAVDPPSALHGFENIWPPAIARLAQGPGDLGARMARAFALAPPGPVVIIGADAPGLRARHLRAAFAALAGADAVFGPAADGGFWLMGLSRRKSAPDLFGDVRWSSEHALADTLASLPAAFRIRALEMLRDVDRADDLVALGPYATAH